MSAPPGGFPFPGMPGAPAGFQPGAAPMAPPGYAPQQAQPQQGISFVLNIPADPTWSPIKYADTLDTDGYFQVRITGDEAKKISEKLQVVVSMEIVDADFAGKNIARFLPDPSTSTKNLWFLWRGLNMSIWGIEGARAAMQYTPGMYTGHIAYVKTAAYMDGTDMRTGIDAWATKEEYEAAKAKGGNAFRWPAKARGPAGGGVGALPGGLPGGAFPGMGGALPPPPTLPGGFATPTGFPPAPMTPQPGAAPMQQQAPAGFPPAPAPMPMAGTPAPAPQAPVGFPPAPQAAPQTAFPGFPPAPPPNGTPQPTAQSVVSSFPGFPPAPTR